MTEGQKTYMNGWKAGVKEAVGIMIANNLGPECDGECECKNCKYYLCSVKFDNDECKKNLVQYILTKMEGEK